MSQPETVLNVFISSPGDCALERRVVRDLILEASTWAEAQDQKIRLHPLLWEDFPPGQGEPGDVQARVNAVLDRCGLKQFHLYIGMMKRRLGTPTARGRSGTIEEFETSRQLHRQSGLPAEVWFYFLRPDQGEPSTEVAAFRSELQASGYLSAEVQDAEELRKRISEHLRITIAEWFHFRRVVQRQLRFVRPIGLAVALLMGALAFLGYWVLDRGGYQKVLEASKADPLRASAVWQESSPYLLIHQAQAKDAVNRAISAKIGATTNESRATELFATWRSNAVHVGFDDSVLRLELATRVGQRLHQAVAEDTDSRAAIELWALADRCGLWSKDSPERAYHLRRVAARELFLTMAEERGEMLAWGVEDLRPFERQAVTEWGWDIIQRSGDRIWEWGDAGDRLLLLSLCPDQALLEQAADREVESITEDDSPPEISQWIAAGTPTRVVAWMTRHLRSNPSRHLALWIFNCATSEGRDPSLPVTFLDLTLHREIRWDPFEDYSLEQWWKHPGFQKLALDRLSALDIGRRPISANALRILLSAVGGEGLDTADRQRISGKVIGIMADEALAERLRPAAVRALASLRSAEGVAYLRERFQAHIAGRVRDMEERQTLAEVLPRFAQGEALSMALTLAKSTREQVFAHPSPAIPGPVATVGPAVGRSTGPEEFVYSEYLDLLSKADTIPWDTHLPFLDQLVTDRTPPRLVFFRPTFGPPHPFSFSLTDVLTRMPDPQVVALLRLPKSKTTDPSELRQDLRRWMYLLGHLAAGKRQWSAELTRQIHDALALYLDPMDLYAVAERQGWKPLIDYFSEKSSPSVADPDSLSDLRRWGTPLQFLKATETLSTNTPSETVEHLLEGAQRLPLEDRRRVVAAVAERLGGSLPNPLLPHALESRYTNEILLSAATDILTGSRPDETPLHALAYLAHIAPARAVQVLASAEVQRRFTEHLAASDPMSWAGLAEALVAQEAAAPADLIESLVAQRHVLLIKETSQLPYKTRDSTDWYRIASQSIRNPLLARIAALGTKDGTRALLDAASGLLAVQTTEPLQDRDPGAAWQAYCLWLVAEAAIQAPLPLPDLLEHYDPIPALRSQQPHLVRGAAAAILATTR